MFQTIISTVDLESRLRDESLIVVDCRSKQAAEFHGETAYRNEHIAGAVYANLDRDLAAPHVPGVTGRHPLPAVEDFVETVSLLGIDASSQVVVYDDMAGAYAARLWWMLRWAGHDAVAVLDGGWDKWRAEGRPTSSGVEQNARANFIAAVRSEMVVDAPEVDRVRMDESFHVIDARSHDRYLGQNETLDPVAGHIPGAVSMQYADNLSAEGLFLPRGTLLDRFRQVSQNAVCYCGSGVTACHNILAFVHAGLSEPRLYVGSWSDWITDRERPVA